MTSGDSRQRPPAWLHVGMAGLVGACFTTFATLAFFRIVFLGDVTVGIFFLIISPFVFQAVNRVFNGPTHGGWAFMTAVAWWAAVILAAVGLTADDGYSERDRAVVLVVAAAVPMMITAMVHPGWFRRIGLVLSCTALAVTSAVLVNSRAASNEKERVEDREQAIANFGSTVRPWVIGKKGYRQNGDPAAVGPEILVGMFYKPKRPDRMLTFTTDASTTTPCGPPLNATIEADVTQPETSCLLIDGIWIRTSKGGHEAALVADDRVIRVAASNDVALQELIDAARSARPMSDRYYRHLLFGEEGEYIPELDGAR